MSNYNEDYYLENLIKDLQAVKPDLNVIIDDGTFLDICNLRYAEEEDRYYCELWKDYRYRYKITKSVFDSWRGDYDELSIQPTEKENNLKVSDLLKMAKFINNKILGGYKGGNFLMDYDCSIYISKYGEVGNKKLIGIKQKDKHIILITEIYNY